nr:uncharacterized protein K02A2.6-like [Drosophila kikkawai]
MDKFKAEVERLTLAGIWKPVKFSNWASPIVLAPKPGGDIRICGDFKQAVNAQIDVEQYPLPTKEALFHIIRHGKQFSKIDLKDAYLQMELDEAAKQIMVVNTPLGLFQYQRLPYGIASAPAIFQRYLEQLLKGIEGCGNYLDDIIISAPTSEEHLQRIEQVLSILQENGIKYASSFGIGVVLSHLQPDGGERPIVFASKTLDKHQAKYSQIEKEALSIVFGVKRFHQYLYGRKFILLTDHKPLVTIFNPSKHLPLMTSNRLQRWAIILMAYNFEIQYRSTSAHGNADALSRLPVGTDPDFDKEEEACYTVLESTPPINSETIRNHVDKDKVLKQVLQYVSEGWPEKLQQGNEALLPYFNRKFALTINKQLLCLHKDANRVVIPSSLRAHILKLLHEGHWGIVRMKQLARQHVWWPTIDDDIKNIAQSCDICKCNNPAPPREFQSWPAATAAWERIHVDFAGPIFDNMWLICVDAYSQFPFVVQMSSTTTDNTIAALSSIFAIEGYPKTLVSDNGPQLTADAFKEFCKLHGVKHITTAPFHPASNGLAERFVQTFKYSVKKNLQDGIPSASSQGPQRPDQPLTTPAVQNPDPVPDPPENIAAPNQQPDPVPDPPEHIAAPNQQPVQLQQTRRRSGIPIRQSTRVRQEVDRYKPKDFRQQKHPHRS